MVEKSLSNLSLDDKGKSIETVPSIIPPPPPPGPLSPATTAQKSPSSLPPSLSLQRSSEGTVSPATTAQKSPSSLPPSLSLQRSSEQQDLDTKREEVEKKEDQEAKEVGVEDAPDDDFGDFQAAG